LTKWLQTFLTPTTNSFALQSKSKHTRAKIEHKVHTSTPLCCGFCATRSKKKQRCRCNEQGKKQRQVATFTFSQHKKIMHSASSSQHLDPPSPTTTKH